VLRIHRIYKEQNVQCIKFISILKVYCCLKFVTVTRCFLLLSALQLRCVTIRSSQNPSLVIQMKVGDFVLVSIQVKPKADFFFNIACKPNIILQLVTEI